MINVGLLIIDHKNNLPYYQNKAYLQNVKNKKYAYKNICIELIEMFNENPLVLSQESATQQPEKRNFNLLLSRILRNKRNIKRNQS